MMRVKDLRDALVDLPEEAVIYLQVDNAVTGLDIVTLIKPTNRMTGRPGVPEVHLS